MTSRSKWLETSHILYIPICGVRSANEMILEITTQTNSRHLPRHTKDVMLNIFLFLAVDTLYMHVPLLRQEYYLIVLRRTAFRFSGTIAITIISSLEIHHVLVCNLFIICWYGRCMCRDWLHIHKLDTEIINKRQISDGADYMMPHILIVKYYSIQISNSIMVTKSQYLKCKFEVKTV